jgi:hypothetical protein
VLQLQVQRVVLLLGYLSQQQQLMVAQLVVQLQTAQAL